MMPAERKVRFTSAGSELVGLVGLPDRVSSTGVVLFHGLSNSKQGSLMGEVASALVARGITTLRFDFYGSGESPGKLSDKTWAVLERNAQDAISFLNKEGAKRIGLFGRSLGGTLAILCADNSLVKAFVLGSTGVYVEEEFVSHFEELKKREHELEARGKRLPGTENYKGEFELGPKFYKELPQIQAKIMRNLLRMKNVLLMATTPDVKVPLRDATMIINSVQEPKRLEIFEGVDHDYKGVEREAIQYTVAWFERHLGDGM